MDKTQGGQFFITQRDSSTILLHVQQTKISIELACNDLETGRRGTKPKSSIKDFVKSLKEYVQTFRNYPKLLYLDAFYRSVSAWKNQEFHFANDQDTSYFTDKKLQEAKTLTVPQMLEKRGIPAYHGGEFTKEQRNVIYIKMATLITDPQIRK